MNYEFKFGVRENVKLVKQDGPVMSVQTVAIDTGGNVYVCTWFDKDDNYATRWFRESDLVSAE